MELFLKITSFFPLTRLTAHNPLSPHRNRARCVTVTDVFHSVPLDLLKTQSRGEDPAFTARQRTADKANVKRQHDKAHRGGSSKGKDAISIHFKLMDMTFVATFTLSAYIFGMKDISEPPVICTHRGADKKTDTTDICSALSLKAYTSACL